MTFDDLMTSSPIREVSFFDDDGAALQFSARRFFAACFLVSQRCTNSRRPSSIA